MNTACTTQSVPWEHFVSGQTIGEDIEVPSGDITITLLIGDGPNPCTRSETRDQQAPFKLLEEIRRLKGQCNEKNCNMCCSRPTKGIGNVTFVSWHGNNQTLTLRLSYRR